MPSQTIEPLKRTEFEPWSDVEDADERGLVGGQRQLAVGLVDHEVADDAAAVERDGRLRRVARRA